MSKVSEQERRAAARAERRARSEQEPPADNDRAAASEDGAEPGVDAGDALRTAATAAIAGAAVGAAKALARRRQQESAEQEERADEEPRGEPEPRAQEPMTVEEDEAPEQPAEAAVDDDVVAGADERQAEQEPEPDPEPEPEAHRPAERGEVGRVVQLAREQLRDLRGLDAESVSSVKRSRDGWRIALDVVELRRIPDSTDVLATYELDLDDDGNLLTFERTARYHRSEAERR